MRMLRLWLSLPLCLTLGGPALLPTSGHTAAPLPRPANQMGEDHHFMARFADGSQVRLTLLEQRVQVQTAYGRLVVPVRELNRIEFGARVTEATQRDVRAAVALLGSKAFEERESASKKLLELGPASYSPLQEAVMSGDLEVARRSKAIVAKLEAAHTEDQLRRRAEDVVHSARFTIVGRIDAEALAVQAKYFGKASLKPNDLCELEKETSGNDLPAAILVSAAQYAGPAVVWLETAITVTKGRRLKIVAIGQIDMYPQPPWTGQYLATPTGPLAAWAGTMGPDGRKPGVLVGKIGKDGKEFVIGAEYEGEAQDSGKLFMRILTSPWQNSSAGEYKVTVSQR
jgi:hypothetical protein